ncbi:low molecular weight phosphatase family protein [Kocuria sp. NPDC057446]|uniref:arsenate-mycothiol transferase ArsC n=1 Tax=Kocuria sp. NPDC057446 TaxID=3346137 RepID=UPI0036A58F4F
MNDHAEATSPLDTHVLERTAERLAARYSGVLSPDVVERVVFESYTALSRTARVRTHLAALAGHFAADRLAALAHARDGSGLPQVLFVGRHDTGRAQIAAALLAHYAGDAAVVRSAGTDPGSTVDPHVLRALAARGLELGQVYPKPLTDDVVRAADHVITFGTAAAVSFYPHADHQDWGADRTVTGHPEDLEAMVAEVDERVRTLWGTIRP